MSALRNPRHEQFAQLIAAGKTPAEAYVLVGYAEKTAYTCGPRLLKQPSVGARVAELQQTVAVATVTRMSLSREFVLRELMDNAMQAKKNQEWSASNRAFELVGKELGMFNHPEPVWDGDLATLTDQQLLRITEQFERAVYGEDRARLEADKRRALRRAGLLVDGEVEPSE
jgi:hypothetical protein